MKRRALDMSNTATEIANVTVTVLISLLDLATIPVRVITDFKFCHASPQTYIEATSISSDETY